MGNNPRNLPILRTEATQVFCSICPDPGHCCREFNFHKTFWKDLGIERAQQALVERGNPFTIIRWLKETYTDEDGCEYAEVRCSCPKVTAEGRCSIYEDRPAVCRRFAPGSNPLCVFSSMSGVEFNWERKRKQTALEK